MKIIDTIDKEYFIEVCNNSATMCQAAAILKLHFNTFARIAKELNCYKPNRGGAGTKKMKNTVFETHAQIFSGNYPEYQTNKLRELILKYNYKSRRCEVCGLETWNDKPIPLELHHIDGDRCNHKLDNLLLICPNCHSQTKTFRGKNSKKNLNGGPREI